jgi:lysophospholipase L1-like esterase
VNSGVGGNTTGQGLERFESDVAAHRPNLVLVEFGYNDCHIVEGTEPRTSETRFRLNQRRIGARIREQIGATPVFIANHPTLLFDVKTNGRTYEANSIVYNAITREVARELNAPLLDMHVRFGRRGTPLSDLLDADGIHLNVCGEAEYAAHVGDFLSTML